MSDKIYLEKKKPTIVFILSLEIGQKRTHNNLDWQTET